MTWAVWLSLAVVAIPVVLLFATAGCGDILPPPDDPFELPPRKHPEEPPGKKSQPDPRGGFDDIPVEVELKPSYDLEVARTKGLLAYWRLDEAQASLPNPATAQRRSTASTKDSWTALMSTPTESHWKSRVLSNRRTLTRQRGSTADTSKSPRNPR